MAHCLDCSFVSNVWDLINHCEKTNHSWDDCLPNKEKCLHERRKNEKI